MKAIIYGRNGHRVLESVADGLRTLGYAVVWRRPSVFTPDQVERDAAFVVVYGMQGACRSVVGSFAKAGIKTLVIDSAYMHRDQDYHQAGWGGLNAPPTLSCPPDRLKGWGEFAPAEKGTDVLIVGQVDGDAQLPPSFNVAKWAADAVERARAEFLGCRIVWKPHPQCEGMECHGADATVTGSLTDALNGCQAIITYNSTAAYEAILRGVKVVCNPSAVYAFHLNNPQEFLQQVAYGQWTAAEFADGSALDFLINGVCHGQEADANEGQRHEGAPADASRNAEAARGDDAGRKARNGRKKGVR